MGGKFDFRPLLELMGLMVLGMLLTAVLSVYVFGAVSLETAATKPIHFLLIVASSLLLSFGMPAWIWLRRNGQLLIPERHKSKKLSFYLQAFFLFVSLVFVADYALQWLTQFLSLRGWDNLLEEPFNLLAVRAVLHKKELLPLVVLVVAFVPAWVEEYFFRRVIFSYLEKQSRSFWAPALLSSLFFAGMHNHFVSFIPIFLLGLGLAFAYFTTGNIWTSITLHALNNTSSILMIYFESEELLAAGWYTALAGSFGAVYIFQRHFKASSTNTSND